MIKKSYLDRTEEQEEALDQPATATPASGLDLSSVAPTPAPRGPADRQAAAVAEGRRRGFGRQMSSEVVTPTKSPSHPQARGGEGAGKRIIVALGTVAYPGQIGQVAISGDAVMLSDFVKRAHWERKTRGELLSEMLSLWEATHGALPADFTV